MIPRFEPKYPSFQIYCSVLTPFKAVLAKSCDGAWLGKMKQYFESRGSNPAIEDADDAKAGRQLAAGARETNVCGELPKSARVLRMVNR